MEISDPSPELTAARDVRLVRTWNGDTGGVVGWSDGGWEALGLSVQHPELPRLVVMSLPFPEEMPDDLDLAKVTAKTLLLYGSADPQTGSGHATRWQRALPNARLEMVPGGGHDILEPMWHRVLSFLAPRRRAG